MRSDFRSLSGAAREREIRRLVRQLKGCLPALAPQAERVLILRAGIGLPHPYSAAQVARLLHLSVGREGLIEDAALLSLQTVAQTDGCDAGSSGDRLLSDAALFGPGPSLSAFAPASLAAAGISAPSRGRHAPAGAHRAPAAPRRGAAVYKASVNGPAPGGGSSWTLFVFIPLMALGLLAAIGLRARRGELAPAGAQAHTEDVPAAPFAPSAARLAPVETASPARFAFPPDTVEEPAESAELVPVPANGSSEPKLPAPIGTGAQATGTALAKREPDQQGWLRQHSPQIALLLTALGGAARLLIRTRHARGRRGRHRVG